MKLKALAIMRKESWEPNAGSLRGSVKLESEEGEVTVTLSPGAISRLIGTIAEEVGQKAQRNAKLVKVGMTEATDECMLIESDGAISGELPKISDESSS